MGAFSTHPASVFIFFDVRKWLNGENDDFGLLGGGGRSRSRMSAVVSVRFSLSFSVRLTKDAVPEGVNTGGCRWYGGWVVLWMGLLLLCRWI
jgi:hypothetical protein